MRIIWGPELQLGHRVIDSQHEELINLLNELNDAVAADHLILADVLRRLDAYVLFHFSTEESLMNDARGAILTSRNGSLRTAMNTAISLPRWRPCANRLGPARPRLPPAWPST